MDSHQLYGVITSDIFILLTMVLLVLLPSLYFLLRKSKNRSVLIMGRTGAGKTRLLCKLCSNTCPITLTSIQPTTLEYTHSQVRKHSLLLVDIPGDGRVRSKYLSEQKSLRIVGVLFMIDSLVFETSKEEVADILFELLSSKQFKKTPILFACNKQDLSPKVSCEAIKQELEREMQIKISTQSSSPDNLDVRSRPTIIGDANSEFSFGRIANKISFVPTSITNETLSENIPGTEHIIEWLLSKI